VKKQYSGLKEQVIEIVKRAAEIAYAPFTVSEKDAPSNIVTSADIGVQKFLEKELCRLLPDSVFFGEEGNAAGACGESLWIVDPIDGTTNFARGISQYAISVALLVQNEIVLGVVYNPALDRLYSAVAGEGALMNGKPIRVSQTAFDRGILCTALSLYRKEYAQACMDIISDVYAQCGDFRRFGTCALELCYLAEGVCDLYFEFRLFPWDFAAASLILKEAGGMISGLNGEPLRFDRTTPIIAANSQKNFEILRDLVKKHLPSVPYTEILR